MRAGAVRSPRRERQACRFLSVSDAIGCDAACNVIRSFGDVHVEIVGKRIVEDLI